VRLSVLYLGTHTPDTEIGAGTTILMQIACRRSSAGLGSGDLAVRFVSSGVLAC